MVLAMKLNAFFKEVKSYFYLLLSAEPTNPGSVDISWGIVAITSLEGCTHRLRCR